jgi:GMP synthase (glutamine-hydrolysing)
MLGTRLQEHSIDYDVINVEQEPIPDPTRYDAVIALGGSQQANDDEKYPYFIEEKALIRKAVEQNIPFLGICLGGQLLAHTLGAPVKRHTMTEVGFFDVTLTPEGKRDPFYEGLPGYQKVFHWHEDTFDLPQGAVHLATSENTFYQAFRYGQRAYGLQYHIELDPPMLDAWLHHPVLKKDMIDTLGIDAYTTLEQSVEKHYPIYRVHTHIIVENFLRIGDVV